jgi:S1-C subfamily serine protease
MCSAFESVMLTVEVTNMTDTSLSDTFAAAVESGRHATVRVEAGRCATTSGTVWDADHVLTSARALRGAEQSAVFDDAGLRRSASLVGNDPGSDVALLRVEGGGLKPLQVAPHDALRVGDLTLALARPGVAIRASLRIIGLLSGELRTPSGGRLDRYIETDRGFPEGFVGGPLVDAHGAWIGMNTDALLRGSDLAVPHATLARSVSELLAHGRVRRGYLGVATQPVRLPRALREELQQRSGALVLETDADGPAQAAGLGLGDVIVALDANAVRSPRELAAALVDKLGATVTLRIVRAGKLENVQLGITERN